MEKEYLSEEKYNKIKKVLKTIGFISLSIAIVLFVISLFIKVPVIDEPGHFEAETLKVKLRAFSFVFGLMIPMFVFPTAYGREIRAFQTQQGMPVAKEGIEKMAPTAGVIAKEITKGVKEGLKEENSDEEK